MYLNHASISSFLSLVIVKCEPLLKIYNLKEESITEDPEKEPITGGSKRTLILKTLKRTLERTKESSITVKPKGNPINEDTRELQNLQ